MNLHRPPGLDNADHTQPERAVEIEITGVCGPGMDGIKAAAAGAGGRWSPVLAIAALASGGRRLAVPTPGDAVQSGKPNSP